MLAVRVLIIVLILAGSLALIGSYTFLPAMIEALVGQSLQRDLGLSSQPNVELESDPPPKILAGTFTRGRVEMSSFDLGGISLDSLTIDLDRFDVEVFASIASGSMKSEEPLSGSVRIELSERTVAGVARSRVNDFPVDNIELKEDVMLVASEIQVLGIDVPVFVDGGLTVRENTLEFMPRGVRAFGAPVPERMAAALLAGTDFSYPLDGLPYDGEITDVEVLDGRMVLMGDVEDMSSG